MLFIETIIRNISIHYVGKMQSFLKKQMVHVVTIVLEMVKSLVKVTASPENNTLLYS
jgi:hypothetical protein